jgi:hypothetical protein
VIADFGFLGLALATTLAAAANAAYVMFAARLRYGAVLPTGVMLDHARLVAATALLCAVVGAGLWLVPPPQGASLASALWLLAMIAAGVLAYLAGLWAVGAREFALIRRLLRRLASASP